MGANMSKIFAGSASHEFAKLLAQKSSLPVGETITQRFSEGNIFVKIVDDVYHQEVVLVQALAGANLNNDLVELLFLIDALKRGDASKITVVIPFFSYAKSDKQDGQGTSIRARVVADCLQVAGADKVMMMDLHSPSIPGFFSIPVEDLSARSTFVTYFQTSQDLSQAVVVSPDAGFAKRARRYAQDLKLPCVIGDKNRPDLLKQDVEILEIIGDVTNKDCIIVDDFTSSAATLVDIATELKKLGARHLWAAVAHAPLDKAALDRLEKSPIEELVTTNTIDNPILSQSARIKVLDVTGVFAQKL